MSTTLHRPDRAGTAVAYQHDKCRCTDCRTAWRDYARTRRHATGENTPAKQGHWNKGNRTTCTYTECTSRAHARTLCTKHYQQLKAQGLLDQLPTSHRTTCTLPDCHRPHDARGYCTYHYNRLVRRAHLTLRRNNPRFCGITDCTRKHHGRDLCAYHYNRLIRPQRQSAAS